MTVDHFEGTRHGEIDPTQNPELANRLSAEALQEEDSGKLVLIEGPPDGTVTLPGGYLTYDGAVVTKAAVREMTGEDEEDLARPAIRDNFVRMISTMISNCTESIGDEKATEKMLDALLLGDREMLLLGIRVATYGDEMRLDLTCNKCKHEFKVDYSFTTDVPVRQLDGMEVELLDSTEKIRLSTTRHAYDIPLRKGGVAEVGLVNGAAQKWVYRTENKDLNSEERNTLLLQQCVQMINGQTPMLSDIRRMGSADRKRILAFLGEAQPGPQWGEVKQTCPECDNEWPLVVSVALMFRGL